jgi:hypothetical protein
MYFFVGFQSDQIPSVKMYCLLWMLVMCLSSWFCIAILITEWESQNIFDDLAFLNLKFFWKAWDWEAKNPQFLNSSLKDGLGRRKSEISLKEQSRFSTIYNNDLYDAYGSWLLNLKLFPEVLEECNYCGLTHQIKGHLRSCIKLCSHQ